MERSEAKELPQKVIQELVELARRSGYEITDLTLECLCKETRGWLTIRHDPNRW